MPEGENGNNKWKKISAGVNILMLIVAIIVVALNWNWTQEQINTTKNQFEKEFTSLSTGVGDRRPGIHTGRAV